MDRFLIDGLHALAASQHNLVSAGQAAALGITPKAMAAACERGWLRRVRRGVYAVAGAPVSQWEAVMGAALAAGPEAVVSHWSAAAIHGFWGVTVDTPELTVPHACRQRLIGVRLHRSRHIGPDGVEMRGAAQVTTPIRTVIEMAADSSDYLLGRILDDGITRRLWSAEQIKTGIDRFGRSGRPSTARLRRLVADRLGEGTTETTLETRVLRVLRGKVPAPVLHHREVLGGRVIDMDMAWLEFRIDGEADGFDAHIRRSDFERDRLRANVLAAHRWRIVHWTSRMDDATIIAQIVPYFTIR